MSDDPSTPPFLSESPDARSKTVTTADGLYTHGALNQNPSNWTTYAIGVSDDKGVRRTMEDAYSYVVDFAGIRGQGFFAIFDGHAGKHAAEWCGQHFHEFFLDTLNSNRGLAIPDVLNKTFHAVDNVLSKMAQEGNTHSGCTAVTAFLRLEDAQGSQAFLDNVGAPSSSPRKGAAERAISPPPSTELRRVLYTANAGDARAVLCRAGKAVRLTYDHKGSDRQEAKRIMDAGGFVMNNRVNGVLAVTRALGDSSMKEFVVGSPYTTETELSDEDEFLIIACDGLWDVAEDQQAVDLIRPIKDAQEASAKLLKHAMSNFSTDNVTALVVRLDTGRHDG
ncbi:protein phosphatase 2C [Exidia glandulosa HHB12029]|uniref:Protein phosphatase 2C n=1 Tax=Exidia glandulosa HHB12029 TaxID=1314781 RepID=A0A165CIM9_EXIGL|nr:protein phosphatase 2C [Exidia glandulosa HHB12029]KZV97103.1 protein phosphatase 2C [Exidia glandulosa HHB12029]